MFHSETEENYIWDHFDDTVVMSTYLVAYSINDFVYKESVVKMTDDVVFKIWARRDALDQVIRNLCLSFEKQLFNTVRV